MTAATSLNYAKLFDLSGRTALVVGGGSGIGEAACLGLAAHGAACAVTDVMITSPCDPSCIGRRAIVPASPRNILHWE